MFEAILTTIVAEGIHLSRVVLNDGLMTRMDLDENTPRAVIQHIFATCARIDGMENENVVYSLKRERIIAFRSEELFKLSKRWNLVEFLGQLTDLLPFAVQSYGEIFSALRGRAFFNSPADPKAAVFTSTAQAAIEEAEEKALASDDDGREGLGAILTVNAYPERDLPTKAVDRLRAMFHVCGKWVIEDLEPYLKPVCSPTLRLDSLLMKYTRQTTTSEGVKVYSSRH